MNLTALCYITEPSVIKAWYYLERRNIQFQFTHKNHSRISFSIKKISEIENSKTPVPVKTLYRHLKIIWSLTKKRNSWCLSRHSIFHCIADQWVCPGWFLGLPTFKALDLSAFYSAQGGGNDCTKIHSEGAIAKNSEKVRFWDVFVTSTHRFF